MIIILTPLLSYNYHIEQRIILYAFKCNLTELTTKSICVPLRVYGIVMHMPQCICPCQRSFVPNSVVQGTCASASGKVLCSLAFWCVCLWVLPLSTCAWIRHVSCSAILHSSIVSGLFPPYPPFFPLYILYQWDGCASSLLHGVSWLGCQDLPVMGAISSM